MNKTPNNNSAFKANFALSLVVLSVGFLHMLVDRQLELMKDFALVVDYTLMIGGGCWFLVTLLLKYFIVDAKRIQKPISRKRK
jgi:hypothetical protein